MMEPIILLSLAVSGFTLVLYLINSWFYRTPPWPSQPGSSSHLPPSVSVSVSVLIPARNEETNIRVAVESILANRHANFEIVVLDDHSSDATAMVLRDLARRDPRVRWAAAPDLPPGWCGKQHACHHLAKLARHPWLIFMDADVRLAPDAIARMVEFQRRSKADLASGVPRQETVGFLDRLLLPLIHFVLMGYLPMPLMRWTKIPSFSAGCGQLFFARRSAYVRAGGHAAIRASLHDGITLPRVFRQAGFLTDLFDATDIASCRMYESDRETWAGLQKNATEGLAAPRSILPMTFLLFTGQILPFVLAGALTQCAFSGQAMILTAMACAWTPRFLAVWRFRQSWWGACLHPLAILILLVNQWWAWIAVRRGKRVSWRDRSYDSQTMTPKPNVSARPLQPLIPWLLIVAGLMVSAGLDLQSQTPSPPDDDSVPALSMPRARSFSLLDQFGHEHRVPFPRTNAVVLTIADRDGASQLTPWIETLRRNASPHFEVYGVAPLSPVPEFLRGHLVRKFAKQWDRPVLLDWGRELSTRFGYGRHQANLYLLNPDGSMMAQFHGVADEAKLHQLRVCLREWSSNLEGTTDASDRQSALHSRSTP